MSLKKNFLYNSLLTVSTYLFPLLVYPYVSRTLGLSNIGIVNFVDSIINYAVLISMMGITTVGVREVAASRNNKEKLRITFNSLFLLTVLSTVIAVLFLLIAMFIMESLSPHRHLLFVGIIKLLFNVFLIEWFFTGLEDFKYITNRSLIVKCLYVAGIFLLVKSPEDYFIYYVISVAAVVINAVVNFIYSRKYVSYSLRSANLKLFTASFFIMGVYILLTNIYTSFNTVWLGFATNTDEVGFFTTATKLHTIVMAVLTSFASIMFPRMSNLLSEGQKEEYWEKIKLALQSIYVFAFPTIIFLLICGPAALHIIVGNGFEGSYLPLQIISPLVLIIGIEQILVIQILMAMHQDRVVLRNSFLGAIVCIIVNLCLTSHYGAIGSAIVWLLSEMFVLFASLRDIRLKYNWRFPYRQLLSYAMFYTILLIIVSIVFFSASNTVLALVGSALIIVVYTAVNEIFIQKNTIVIGVMTKLKRK